MSSLNYLDFNLTLLSVKEEKALIFSNKFLEDFKYLVHKGQQSSTKFSEEEGIDEKLCFLLSEIETLPIIPHLAPILAIMQSNLDEVWMQSD